MDWNRLSADVDRSQRVSCWRNVFGEAYAAFADCLIQTGGLARSIWCDSCKSCHEVLPVSEGDGFVAVCKCKENGREAVHMSVDEVAEWMFSAKKLGRKLGNALGVGVGEDVQDEGFGIVDLGACPRHPELLHVWLVACPVFVWPERFLQRLKCAGGGCILIASVDPYVEIMAHAAGLTFVPMAECFKVGPEGIKGLCGERCRETETCGPS